MRNVQRRKTLTEFIAILGLFGGASLGAAQYFKTEHTTSAFWFLLAGLVLLGLAFGLFLDLLRQVFPRRQAPPVRQPQLASPILTPPPMLTSSPTVETKRAPVEIKSEPKPVPSFKSVTDPRTEAIRTVPFPSGDGNSYTEYTEDVFHGIIWRWHYKPEIDNTPRNLTPFCPECERPRPLDWSTAPIWNGKHYLFLECKVHPQKYQLPLRHDPFGDPLREIRALIEQKLKTGSWIDVVNRQRMARHQAPLGGPGRQSN